MQTLIKQFKSIDIKNTLNQKDHVYDLRQEYKFVVPIEHLETVLLNLKDDFYSKYCDDSHLFQYKNLYFDTADLLFFRMHRQGKYNRLKVRIREYQNGIPGRYLECKEKIKGQKNKKKRRIFSKEKGDQLSGSDFLCDLLRRYNCQPSDLCPSVEISYNRLHFISKNQLFRLTIDFDLRANLPNQPSKALVPSHFVLEIKSNQYPKKITRFLRRELNVRQESFSKYCVSLCMLNPNMKRNRWKSAFKKYF